MRTPGFGRQPLELDQRRVADRLRRCRRSDRRRAGSGGAPDGHASGSVARPERPAAAPSSAPAGHGRQDDQRVALADRRLEPVEHAHVLVVEVDVDVAVQLAVGAEQLAAAVSGCAVGERVEDLADVRAVGADLAARRRRTGAGPVGCGRWP